MGPNDVLPRGGQGGRPESEGLLAAAGLGLGALVSELVVVKT